MRTLVMRASRVRRCHPSGFRDAIAVPASLSQYVLGPDLPHCDELRPRDPLLGKSSNRACSGNSSDAARQKRILRRSCGPQIAASGAGKTSNGNSQLLGVSDEHNGDFSLGAATRSKWNLSIASVISRAETRTMPDEHQEQPTRRDGRWLRAPADRRLG
jgi:hypothetical protein